MVNTASDIPLQSWIDKYAPSWLRPYLRLARMDRLSPASLLLLPSLWAIALAPPPLDLGQRLWIAFLFTIGSVIMRGAGCVVNDILDRDFDAKVARTSTRPIPSGEVSVRQALVFLAVLMGLGLLILLSFNWLTVALGVFSVLLIVIYPLMKRITWWPQAFLGLTFNWGALMGWTAVAGTVDPAALALYVAGLFWTLGYDTIYAHQDKEDDALIGVKSSALLLGERTQHWVAVFYAIMVCLLFYAGWLAGLGLVFALFLLPVAGHLAWQVLALRIDDPARCLVVFRANRDAGLLVLAAICLGVWFAI